MEAKPDGFITAIVHIPCDNADKFAQGKFERLAREVHLSFGRDAEVRRPDGKRVIAPNT